MKLSEAIRLGAMNGQQVFGCLTDLKGGTCAQGAALLAVGLLQDAIDRVDVRPQFKKLFPVAMQVQWCPACTMTAIAGNLMVHLNNDHKWSRKQIADWVETIEQAQDQNERRAIAEGQPMEHAQATAAA